MNKKIVIFGAGGHARVIADIIKAEGDQVVAFLDDDTSLSNCSGPISDYHKYSNCEYAIGIGNTDVREKLSELKIKWHTAIHPSVVISDSVTVGEGTVIMPGSIINSGAYIGKHCIINSGAIVEHDNRIGDFAHISVGVKLGGTVTVGEKSWIGIGAVVKNNCNICSNALIGAGAVVIKDINEKGTYVGVPAKKIK